MKIKEYPIFPAAPVIVTLTGFLRRSYINEKEGNGEKEPEH